MKLLIKIKKILSQIKEVLSLIKEYVNLEIKYSKVKRELNKLSSKPSPQVTMELKSIQYIDLVNVVTAYCQGTDKVIVFHNNETRKHYIKLYQEYANYSTTLDRCMDREDTEYIVLPAPKEYASEIYKIMIRDFKNKYIFIL